MPKKGIKTAQRLSHARKKEKENGRGASFFEFFLRI
jgi:hypothetical protein